MAGRWLITAANNDYTGPGANIWHSLEDEAEGDTFGFNEGADIAAFSALSGNLTLSAAMACQGLQQVPAYAGTVALGANALDVNGAFQFAGSLVDTGNISAAGSITLYADADLSGWTGVLIHDGTAGGSNPTLTTNDVAIPTLTINNAGIGSFTLADDLTVGDLTYTAGRFTTDDRTVTLIADGVARDVDWNAGLYALAHLVIPDNAKANLTARLYTNEVTIGSGVGGASITSANDVRLWKCLDDPWHQTPASGTVSILQLAIYFEGDRTFGYLDGSNCTNGVLVWSNGDRGLTLTENWVMGGKALDLQGYNAGETATLDTNGQGILGYPPITLGVEADADKSGALLLRTGDHELETIVAGHPTGNLANAIDFASCNVTMSENVNLDNVAVISAEANLFGAVNLSNFDCTGILFAGDAADGGNNGDVLFTWRVLTPAVATCPMVSPSIGIAIGRVLTPSAAVSLIVAATTQLDMAYTVSAVAIPMASPSIGIERFFNPDVAATPILAPTTQLDMGLSPGVSAIPMVAPSSQLEAGLSPSAVEMPVVAPSPQLEMGLSPSPAVVLIRCNDVYIHTLEFTFNPTPAVIIMAAPNLAGVLIGKQYVSGTATSTAVVT